MTGTCFPSALTALVLGTPLEEPQTNPRVLGAALAMPAKTLALKIPREASARTVLVFFTSVSTVNLQYTPGVMGEAVLYGHSPNACRRLCDLPLVVLLFFKSKYLVSRPLVALDI